MGWIFRALLTLVLMAAVAGAIAYFTLRRPDIPYAELELRYATPASRYVDLPNGVRMHYRDEGQTNGPVIVLLHGYSSSLHTWEQWETQLGENYRVISLDLPGHGLTRAPADYHGSIEAYVGDLAAFAQAMQLTRFALGGNSMGGHVAWEYALAHPEKLEALILVDTGGWAPDQADAEQAPLVFKLLSNPLARTALRDIDSTPLVRNGLKSSFADPNIADAAMVTRYVELSRAPGHRAILMEIVGGERNYATPERLAQISTPTLILHGREDRIIAPRYAEHFHDAIQGSELVLYDNVGHLPQEEAADSSATAVQELLYRLLEGPVLAPATQ